MTDLDTAMPVRERGGYRQSALVLGGAQLGGAYGIANTVGMPDDDATARLLRTAAGLGVTHVDTARAYGDSEHRIGACRVPSLRVITKVAPLGDAAGAEAVRQSVTRSLAELGVDRVTLLLHRAADATGAVWETLRGYADEHVADRIGVSVQSPDELRTVLGLPDLGYVQLPCNLLDRRWLAPDLTESLAARPDLVVTARSVYLQGLLAAGGAVRWPHLPDDARDTLVGTLDRLAAELGRDGRVELCLAYVLGLPWVTSVVIGAETEEQLRRNVSLAARPPLTADERAAVLAVLPEVPDALLDPSRWSS